MKIVGSAQKYARDKCEKTQFTYNFKKMYVLDLSDNMSRRQRTPVVHTSLFTILNMQGGGGGRPPKNMLYIVK